MNAKEELEVKIRIGDPRPVIDAITAMGGRLLRSVVEDDTYFGHPCKDFASTDEALRLRISDGTAELTYKGPRAIGEAKLRLEMTVDVRDPAAVTELLRRLGFEPVARIIKRRIYYSVGTTVVSLDHVEGLGDFVEVEAADAGLGVQGLKSVVLSLGLEWNPLRETYLEMILAAQR